jgi:hypothetical protein
MADTQHARGMSRLGLGYRYLSFRDKQGTVLSRFLLLPDDDPSKAACMYR